MSELITRACQLLKDSQIVAIPTETVYGLAVDSTNDTAIATLYSTKKRPTFNPLILHVTSLEQALQYGEFSSEALLLAQKFWHPGTAAHRPLTLIVPVKRPSKISKLASSGLPTVGIRVPDHPLTQALLKAYPFPLAAPSANLSTQISATNAQIVRKTFDGIIPLILDGGSCRVGLESTIIDASLDAPCVILRYGGTTLEELKDVLGYQPAEAKIGETIKAPGMMKRHYAPSIPLHINQIDAHPNEAYLGFGAYNHGAYNLSADGNLIEATANLFRMLFELDDPARFTAINVAPIPMQGLGVAINDRLQRAASSN